MTDEITVAATTHTLCRSTFNTMSRVIRRDTAEPFKLNEEVDFGTLCIGGQYDAVFKLYPGGREKRSPASPWPTGSQREVVLSMQISVKVDPTGAAMSGTHWIVVSVYKVDANGQCKRIDITERIWLEEMIACGYQLGIGRPKEVCKFKTIKLGISIKTITTPIKLETPTKHWQQRLKMYENSKKYGDITLRIIGVQEQKEEPSRKRRKIDKKHSIGIGESEDVTIKTSSIALRSASAVFESMMSSNMKEKEEGIIEIHAANVKDVDDMLYYIMVQDLRQDVDPLSLIKLAHLYQLTTLFNACSARMAQTLRYDNFIETAKTFERYEIKDGYDHLIQFGRDHIHEIKQWDGFKDLPFSLKYGLLDSDMVKGKLLPEFF